MTTPTTIVGFSSSNRVPGFYGETKYGAGPISAASIPLLLLLVGTMISGGTATANQDIPTILSADDADGYFGAGSEISRQCYAALGVDGVTIKAAPIPEAGGAVAGTCTFTISGTWSTAGTLTIRLNGEIMQLTIGASDVGATVATNLAALINQNPRRPFTAVAGGSGGLVVTVTTLSKSARANQYIAFQDTTKVPSGFSSVLAGGSSVTGGGVLFASGSGVDNPTTLIALIANQQFDRISHAANDSTNLGRWATALNTAAGPTSNLLEHFVGGFNGSLSSANSLATGVNSQRMQLMWYLNGETAPWEMSAYFAALRCATEQGDPCAAYDDTVLPIAPQSQALDRPSNATLQSAINNGVTPVYTPTGAQALVCRSVTTHTLSGSTPDYRTLDTSDAYVPDFVRRDIGLMWTTDFKPNNPRVQDDVAADQKAPPAGVATPSLWNDAVTRKLRNYEKGILSSSSTPGAATVAPIITAVSDNLPTSQFDPVAKRIMSTIPVIPAANHHQIGVSVRQLSAA